jgi:uncharacterized protein with ParB-like and HNH nuclease domain
MSSITPHYRTIQQLLQNQSFSIDVYQREYKWEKENIDELLTDLRDKFLASYQEGHETTAVATYKDYFLGSIIISKRNGGSYLVDGQQRVTSLTLLLIYLYRAAQEQGLAVAQSVAPLIFSDNLGKPSFNLNIEERLPVIEALFKGEEYTPDGKEESIRTIYARYGDIQAADLVGELDEALPHFIYWLMTKVGLIEISTDDNSYAYLIFETMNDRGKPLSPVDMLKAYLLAPISEEKQRDEANKAWKQQVLNLITWRNEHEPERDANCIKAWLRAQYANSIRERRAGSEDKDWELIGSTFHRWVRDELQLNNQNQTLRFIREEFPFFAQAYLHILAASRNYTPGLEAVFYNAHNNFTWQNTVLLAPLTSKDSDDIVRRKMAAVATYLDIWIMRRVTNYIRVSYSSTSYTMYNLSKDIRRKPLPELVDWLHHKLTSDENDDITFDGSPSRGRNGIKDLYLNQFSGRYIYHLLARVTSFVEKESGMADRFYDYVNRGRRNAFDIEHIAPNDFKQYQSEFANINEFHGWRNHVAGLLLLPADVNRSLKAKPFPKKAPHYAKENLYAASLTAFAYEHKPQFRAFQTRNNLDMEPYEKFGKAELDKRSKVLEQLVKLVWSPDRLYEVLG